MSFQSAPRSRDRGDAWRERRAMHICEFQSAPRSRDRGDRFARGKELSEALFQSAPRSRDRGDAKYRVLYGYYCCFNPRPGHATGATSKTKSTG